MSASNGSSRPPQGGGFRKELIVIAILMGLAIIVFAPMIPLPSLTLGLIKDRGKKDEFDARPTQTRLEFIDKMERPPVSEPPAQIKIVKEIERAPAPEAPVLPNLDAILAELGSNKGEYVKIKAQLDQQATEMDRLREERDRLLANQELAKYEAQDLKDSVTQPYHIEEGASIVAAFKPKEKPPQPEDEDHPVPKVFEHRSPYTLYEGTMITAELKEGINSELSGGVTAMVTQPVYDTISGEHVILRPGDKLLGRYEGATNFNAARLGIIWHRLIMTDGRQVRLNDAVAAERDGRVGVTGKVKTRFWRILRAAALSTIFRIGTRSLGGRVGSDQGTDAGQEVAVEASESIGDAGGQVLRRELGVKPIIDIPAGKRIHIRTAHDLIITPRD